MHSQTKTTPKSSQEPTLKEKTAKGIFWGGISNGVQQIISVLFGIVLARILSPGEYGMVGMLALFNGIACALQESGFTAALVNKKDIKTEDYNAVFWFSFLSGIVLYIILYLTAPLISIFFNQPELTDIARVLFLGFVISGIGVSHNAFLLKNLMVKKRAVIDIIATTLSAVIGLYLALNHMSYWSLVIQSLSFIVVTNILRWFLVSWKPSVSINFKPLKEFYLFSFKLLLTRICHLVNTHIFSVLLGKAYDETQVGYYSQGQKWMTIGVLPIGNTISGIAQPIFANVTDDNERLVSVFRKLLRFIAFITFPVMFGIAFISNELIVVTIGEKWLNCVPILQILCIYGAFGPIWDLHIHLLVSRGKSNLYFWFSLLFGIIQLAIVLAAFPLGLINMLKIYTLTYILGLLILHVCTKKYVPMKFLYFFKDILPYIIITIAVFFITYLIMIKVDNLYLSLAGKIVISVILYIGVMWGCRSAAFWESMEFLLKKKKLFDKNKN